MCHSKNKLNDKIKFQTAEIAQKRGVISHELLGGHACYGHAAMVMWLYGHAYQLERKLHGGREEEKNGEEQRERQKKFNIRETSQHIAFILMRKALWYLAKLHH